MIYDGDCGFCRREVARWQALTGPKIDYAPFQEVAALFPEIPGERFTASVQFIETDGTVTGGAEAVFRLLAYAQGRRWLLGVYRRIPAAAALSEWAYRWVARHRGRFPTAESCSIEGDLRRPTYWLSGWLFLKGMGVIYLIAFASLWSQIEGLVGSNGILPVQEFLSIVQRQIGPERYWLVPTLSWLNASDLFLHLVCGGGVVLSLLLILGIAPIPVLFLLWTFYLSLSTVCREFLSFQWDILLLEAGFLSIFLPPLTLRPRLSGPFPPSPTALWLLRWLLFRLIFSSGVVKLSSGDPNWWNLTALTVHYETQPLPTWTSWYVHQLPVWFQKGSALGMFAVELVVPFLIFGPRRFRLLAAGGIVFLQGLIMGTGNYCFFNLLTVLLCLLLVDDSVWLKVRWAAVRFPSLEAFKVRRWPVGGMAPLTAVVLLVTTVHLTGAFRVRVEWPRPVLELVRLAAPFRTFNGYGLFAVMTTSRPEIIVEGSQDGLNWVPYEFKYKPGDPHRKPRFVAPHQPRLDWQMWFAALGSYQENPWFVSFCVRLLQGSPEVLGLLKDNPFPKAPPRYIRAVLYDYRFTDFQTRRATGDWWRRQKIRLYCPALTLREENVKPPG